MVYNVIYVFLIIILQFIMFGTQAADNELVVDFNISSPSNRFQCNLNRSTIQEAKVGDMLHLNFFSAYYINYYKCTVEQSGYTFTTNGTRIKLPNNLSIHHRPSAYIRTLSTLSVRTQAINKDMEGPWKCLTYILKDGGINGIQLKDVLQIKDENNHTYVVSECQFNIKLKDIPVPQDKKAATGIDYTYIYIGAGLIMLVIIIFLPALKVYFKMKARIENLSHRIEQIDTSGNDTKRYSSTPVQKTKKVSRLLGKKGSNECIYETLEELQMGSISPPTPPIENIPTLRRDKKSEPDISHRPPLPLPTEPPKFVETMPPPAVTQPSKYPNVEKSRPGVDKVPLTPVPGNKNMLKQLAVSSSIVTSELDSIFKNRQNNSNASKMSTLPSKKPQSKNMPPPKMEKSAPVAPNSNTLPSPSVKRSLPEIKTQFTKEHSEPPQARLPFPPSKQLPMVPKKPQGKPLPAAPPINPVALKPVPPLPTPTPMPPATTHNPQQSWQTQPSPSPPATTHNPPQPWQTSSPTPNVTVTPILPQNEPVYEAYEEEPVYNSDEEWTYEPLPQYNIYSS